jgi:uncharacterized membrane protein
MRLVRTLVSALSACAFVAIGFTALFGFEEPNNTLMLLSFGLLAAAVVVVVAHLGVTRTLTPAQKRTWLRELFGRKAPYAWGVYLTCDDLVSAANRFSEEALARECRAGSPRDHELG